MSDADPDQADVARAVAGDATAYAPIVGRWQGRLVSLAFRFCRDRQRAEDMAQEAFVKAFRSLHSFRGEAAFGTWLTAIALNVYRSRLRADGPPLVSLDLARVVPARAEALVRLVERERAETVRRMVLTLPSRYRDAIVLYYFEDRNLEEAARVLGVPDGTLKAWLHRGRQLLRRRLEGLGFDSVAAAETVEA